MRTLAGQQYLKAKLSDRVRQYNRIDELNAGMPLEPAITESMLSPNDRDVIALGLHLDAISDAIATGSFDKTTVDDARRFYVSVATIGWRIPQNLLTPILRDVIEYISELARATGIRASTYALSADRKKIVRQVILILDRAKLTP